MKTVRGIISEIGTLEERIRLLKGDLKVIDMSQDDFDFLYWDKRMARECIGSDANKLPTPRILNFKCKDCKKFKPTTLTSISKLKELESATKKKGSHGVIVCAECQESRDKKIREEREVFYLSKTRERECLEEKLKQNINFRKYKVEKAKKEVISNDNLAYMDYKEYLKTPHWLKLKKQIRKRAKNKCEKCGSNKELHTHHLTYERRGHELLSDLICVCKKCHEEIHGRKFEVR